MTADKEPRAMMLLRQGMSDCWLISLRWGADGQNVIFEFGCPPDEVICIKFLWVTNLYCNLQFDKECSGHPLVWESKLECNNNEFDVFIDFGGAPKGTISFKCNDIIDL